MPRNVEIKAKVKDFARILTLAKRLCNTDGEILKQEDTFFVVPSGRLKLRNFKDGATSQLIYYNRPDVEGPKVSDYSICKISNPSELICVLKPALGVKGEVKKTRHLFLYGQTRIHLDEVEKLGNFMELEVVLTPDQTFEDGKKVVDDLMNKLEITEEDLITGAYLDQLS